MAKRQPSSRCTPGTCEYQSPIPLVDATPPQVNQFLGRLSICRALCALDTTHLLKKTYDDPMPLAFCHKYSQAIPSMRESGAPGTDAFESTAIAGFPIRPRPRLDECCSKQFTTKAFFESWVGFGEALHHHKFPDNDETTAAQEAVEQQEDTVKLASCSGGRARAQEQLAWGYSPAFLSDYKS